MSSQIRWLVAIHVCGIVVWNIQCFKTNKLFYWSPYLSISSWSVVIYGYVSPCKLKLNILHLLMCTQQLSMQEHVNCRSISDLTVNQNTDHTGVDTVVWFTQWTENLLQVTKYSLYSRQLAGSTEAYNQEEEGDLLLTAESKEEWGLIASFV